MAKDQVIEFTATGSFLLRNELLKEEDTLGRTVGYRLPDGRVVQLIIALEVETLDGKGYEYITSEREMDNLGFGCLDYDRLEFEAI